MTELYDLLRARGIEPSAPVDEPEPEPRVVYPECFVAPLAVTQELMLVCMECSVEVATWSTKGLWPTVGDLWEARELHGSEVHPDGVE